MVQVSGPCLDESDNITCVFDGQETEGVFVGTTVALCLSPPLMTTGGLPFQLVVRSADGSIRSQGTAEFFSCKHVQNYILPISFTLLYICLHISNLFYFSYMTIATTWIKYPCLVLHSQCRLMKDLGFN